LHRSDHEPNLCFVLQHGADVNSPAVVQVVAARGERQQGAVAQRQRQERAHELLEAQRRRQAAVGQQQLDSAAR
jgi:hypothetical protein